MAHTIKITLSGTGGELDSINVAVESAESDEGAIRAAVIGWLLDEQVVLAPGDSIQITEAEG